MPKRKKKGYILFFLKKWQELCHSLKRKESYKLDYTS
jgi:hypothetical protein